MVWKMTSWLDLYSSSGVCLDGSTL